MFSYYEYECTNKDECLVSSSIKNCTNTHCELLASELIPIVKKLREMGLNVYYATFNDEPLANEWMSIKFENNNVSKLFTELPHHFSLEKISYMDFNTFTRLTRYKLVCKPFESYDIYDDTLDINKRVDTVIKSLESYLDTFDVECVKIILAFLH